MSQALKSEAGRSWDSLLQQAIDGTLSTKEKTELSEALSSDPALQAQLDDYRRLSTLMGGLQMEEPSADFTNQVMSALPAGLPASATSAPSRAPNRMASPARQTGLFSRVFGPRVRLAYAFSAIAMIAVAGVFILQVAEIAPGAATGTIVSSESGAVSLSVGEAALNIRPVESGEQVVALVPVGSILKLTVSGDLDSGQFALNATRPVDIRGSEEAYTLLLTGSGTLTATLWTNNVEVASESIVIE